MSPEERLEKALLVQELYPNFVDFCRDVMKYLGFELTWMQADIAEFMQHGPDFSMVSAQRGEAKSTVACIFAVWCLIQRPSTRVMLISGTEDKAAENGTLIYRIISRYPLLDYLAPDKNAGDKTSLLEFDIHWSLRGLDKSASVVCRGITSGIAGYRADILIPDDVENVKNGLTHTQRNQLMVLCREFSAIVTHGRILYLGTPQTKDSIYNSLPARGYTVRIWPGRFPNATEIENYGECLAPKILERIQHLGPKCQVGGGLDGTRGWSTDPQRYTDQELSIKELDNGPEYFQLQYMLDTSLVDAMRQQIKLKDLIIGDFDRFAVPETLGWAAEPKLRLELGPEFPVAKAELYRPAYIADRFVGLEQIVAYVDPAGEGGDELAFVVGGNIGPFIHLIGIGGFRGGLSEDNLEKFSQVVLDLGVKRVLVEDNMGAGTVSKLILNYFIGLDKNGRQRVPNVGVENRHASGQKERRIIDTIRPVVQRHRLIVHNSALEMDLEYNKQYPMDKRNARSLFTQMHSITTDRGCLDKDDRIDALEGLVRELAGTLVLDEDKLARARDKNDFKKFLEDPMDTKQFKSRSDNRRPSRSALRRRGL